MKYSPHDYQKKAIKFLLQQACAGLFLDPGLGKTSIVYAAFKVLKKETSVDRMLVIAPLRPATSTWPREQMKWHDFHDLRVHVLHGSQKQALLDAPHDISVINPEGLPWLFSQLKGKRVPWDVLVVDESTRFKHSNTARFRTLRPWLKFFRRRVILTGSPSPNGLLDLFGQIYILDLGSALGEYITHYRNSYFDSTGYGGFTWVLQKGAEKRIQDRIKPLVLRMSAEDHLNLEPYISNTIEVDLPPKARHVYLDMEEELVAAINDKFVTAANAGAASIKCRQIANGGLYYQDGTGEQLVRKSTHVHDAKTEAVQELVEELGGKPVLIAYEFQHDLERLRVAFPDAPALGAGVTMKRSREIEDDWNAGKLPVLLVQPKSAAHGLNLQGVGAAVIWHSLTFNLEEYEQLIRRVWRQGQRERVVVHHIVARNTVDEVIMKVVAGKDHSQRALLEALKTHLSAPRAQAASRRAR